MTGDEYRTIRKSLGTQQEVARLLGVSQSRIAERENERAYISAEQELALRWLRLRQSVFVQRTHAAVEGRLQEREVLDSLIDGHFPPKISGAPQGSNLTFGLSPAEAPHPGPPGPASQA